MIPKNRESVLRGDASIDESIDSTPPRRTVKKTIKPPPIRDPARHFEDSNKEEEGKEETIESLKAELAAMNKKFIMLEERCAEGELWKWEINDKIEILRKGLSSKFRRLANATGHLDIYDPPMP